MDPTEIRSKTEELAHYGAFISLADDPGLCQRELCDGLDLSA